MLLRLWKEEDYLKIMAVGQFTMLAALPILVFGVWTRITQTVPALLLKVASVGFWEGFCMGFGITLALFSAVMNIRGIRAWKHTRNG